MTLLLCMCAGAWATDYYTPTSDEVIILNDVYNNTATSTGYSDHSAVTWAGTASTSSKTAGDPSNAGAATSSKVACYSIKNNGKGKNISLTISGVSKITLYHERHAERYPQLILTPSSGSGSTLDGNTNVYYNDYDLDGTKSYTIALQGYDGSSNQDFYVYAIKLTKYVSKTIDTQTLSGVKLGGSALTEDAATNGYSVSGTTITLSSDLVSYAKPTTVTLTNHITYTDASTEDKNVSVSFGESPAEGYWTGTATIGATTYTVKIPYVSQSVTGVTINGSAISASNLTTLTSTKSVTIDGSSLNGIGTIGVTLNSGTTTVSRNNSGNNAVFTFTLNSDDNYTVTVTNVKKTYTAEGSVFSATAGLNVNTHTANGITFTMVNSSKNFQYGTGRLTMGESELVPLKLSTGSAVNVTFPDYKVATKVKVYGWSAGGDGKLSSMGETSELTKSVDVSSDIFYATNTNKDIYPSVYEHELDNWESLYFNPGGSPSQPFVIMDFVLADTRTALSSFAFEGGVTSVFTTTIASFVAPKLTATYGGSDVLSGLTANITYASNNTSVATVNETTGAVSLTGTAGTAKITATFAGNATYANTSTSYTITVSVNPEGSKTLTWTLSPLNSSNAELTSSQVSTSTALTDLETINVSKVGFAGSPSNAENRTAKINRLAGKDVDKYIYVTFEVADGYTFTPSSIAIKVANVSNVTTFDAELVSENDVTVSETAKSFASTDGTVETWTINNADDSKKMTGAVTLKIYAYAESAGSFRFGNTITISGTVAQTLVPVGTISGRNYASYVTTKKLDFSAADGITAYIATGLNGASDAVVIKSVDVVPAGTPIIVKTDTKGATVNVPVTTASASDVSGNKLVAGDGSTSYSAGTYYYLASDLFHLATSGTLQSGKAYLQIPSPARQLGIVFGDEATGIHSIDNGKLTNDNDVYDLRGQRVAQPKKGLYIVNGKKVVIK